MQEQTCPNCGSKLVQKPCVSMPCAGTIPVCPKCGWGSDTPTGAKVGYYQR